MKLLVQGGIDLLLVCRHSREPKKNKLALLCTYMYNDEWYSNDFFVFVCLFVLSRTSNFSAIWQLSPLPATGLQI
jgi:hypothetical protein